MSRFVASGLLILACTARGAAASGFVAPEGGTWLASGRSAIASYELPRGFSGIEEMELVLSLDGGATFPLRLTGELEPGARRVGWRVPGLPTSQAVLGLRAGDADGAERIVLVSGIFTVVGDPSVAPDDIRLAQGEWRTREAGFAGAFPFADGSLGAGKHERLSTLARETAFVGRSLPHRGPFSRAAGRSPAVQAVSAPSSLHSRIPQIPVRLPRRE